MSAEEIQVGEARVDRFIHDARNVILAQCKVDGLHRAWQDHVRTWDLHTDPLGDVMMRQALGGLALYLSCRLRDENFAFTLNVKEPPLNLFVVGSVETGDVTGRYFTEDVKTAEGSRLFVELSRRSGRHSSVIDVQGLDVLQILEDYSRRSDQVAARFFEITDDEYLMAALLPCDDREWFETLTLEQAMNLRRNARPLDSRAFWFRCGCDPTKMTSTLKKLFSDRMEELFQGEPSLVVACPRCGRSWRIRAEDL